MENQILVASTYVIKQYVIMQEARPTAEMRADAYSLLGAYFVEKDMHRATTYWLKSISIRTAEPCTTDPDGPLSAAGNPAYNYAREVRDVDSLTTISSDVEAMFMQVMCVSPSCSISEISWLISPKSEPVT